MESVSVCCKDGRRGKSLFGGGGKTTKVMQQLWSVTGIFGVKLGGNFIIREINWHCHKTFNKNEGVGG